MEDKLNEYMVYYKQLPLKEKQGIILEQLKMLTSLTNRMCKEIDAPNEILINKEITDLQKENYTEDDFAEAVILLLNSIQNSICDFDLKLKEINDNM